MFSFAEIKMLRHPFFRFQLGSGAQVEAGWGFQCPQGAFCSILRRRCLSAGEGAELVPKMCPQLSPKCPCWENSTAGAASNSAGREEQTLRAT